MKVSFVVPCYNSAGTIGGVVDSIGHTMGETGDEYEVILVNDCSPDNTFEVLREICAQNSHVKAIGLAKNFGQHAALMAGFHHVTGDVVVCLDDDGQTPPAEAPKLLAKIGEGYDVVYASYGEKKHSLFRNFGSAVNDRMARYLLNKPKDLYISSYFAARRFVIDKIIEYDNPFPYVIGLVLRTTKSITNVPVDHKDRAEGQSGYTFTKLFSLWLNGFTAFSVKPLRVSALVGVLVAIAGFAFGIYTVINKIINPSVPMGWSSTMVALLIIGGMILLVLGLIGEYIGRMYISINKSPQFVIKEIVGHDEE